MDIGLYAQFRFVPCLPNTMNIDTKCFMTLFHKSINHKIRKKLTTYFLHSVNIHKISNNVPLLVIKKKLNVPYIERPSRCTQSP